MTTLTFQNTTLSVIDQHNQKWIPALEVGRALGYKNPSSDISNLYERNQDEFTASMTAIIEMETASGVQNVRIFSLRGCWLLGMRSHTKVAKDFRKWVLDILDKEINQPQQIAPVEKTFTHTHTESDIKNIIWGHFEALRMLDFIREITPALEALGSKFAPDAYSIGVEYGSHLNYLTPTIHAMADGVDFSENNRPLRRIEQELAKPKTERIYR